MWNRIIIIGSPGAGKSTFARKLRDVSGLPLYYLDRIYHRADRTTVSRAEFDTALGRILDREKWIIDGNYQRTLERRLERCDTVFLLDYPLDVCLDGARSRIGTVREDMPWVEEGLDDEFRTFIEAFPQDTLPKIYALLEEYREGRQVYVFHSREESEAYLNDFAKQLRRETVDRKE